MPAKRLMAISQPSQALRLPAFFSELERKDGGSWGILAWTLLILRQYPLLSQNDAWGVLTPLEALDPARARSFPPHRLDARGGWDRASGLDLVERRWRDLERRRRFDLRSALSAPLAAKGS